MLSHYELARRGVDVTTPKGLARLLRHRELWPRGFEWDYDNFFSCGMALLYRALDLEMPAEGTAKEIDDCVSTAAKILDLDFDTAKDIFLDLYFEGQETSAEQVAEALESCATRRWRRVRRHARRAEIAA